MKIFKLLQLFLIITSIVLISSCDGEDGLEGPKGPDGATGPNGLNTGDTGAIGPTGATGGTAPNFKAFDDLGNIEFSIVGRLDDDSISKSSIDYMFANMSSHSASFMEAINDSSYHIIVHRFRNIDNGSNDILFDFAAYNITNNTTADDSIVLNGFNVNINDTIPDWQSIDAASLIGDTINQNYLDMINDAAIADVLITDIDLDTEDGELTFDFDITLPLDGTNSTIISGMADVEVAKLAVPDEPSKIYEAINFNVAGPFGGQTLNNDYEFGYTTGSSNTDHFDTSTVSGNIPRIEAYIFRFRNHNEGNNEITLSFAVDSLNATIPTNEIDSLINFDMTLTSTNTDGSVSIIEVTGIGQDTINATAGAQFDVTIDNFDESTGDLSISDFTLVWPISATDTLTITGDGDFVLINNE